MVIQNAVKAWVISLEDDWGCLDGKVELSLSLFLNILHPNNIQITEPTRSTFTLIYGGDNMSAARSDLQTDQPYIISLKSSGALASDTVLQIMVGFKAKVVSAVADMTNNK